MQDFLIDRIKTLSAPLKPRPTAAEPRLARLEGIRAVVFDIYGTLVISGSGDVGAHDATGEAQALLDALDACGIEARSPEAGERGIEHFRNAVVNEHERRRKASPTESPEIDVLTIWQEVLQTLEAEDLVDRDADEETLAQFAIEYECRANPVWPMPHAQELFSNLSEHGLPMGIVSNAQFYTPLLFPALFGGDLASFGVDPHLCIYSYQMRLGKPSTRLYEALRERLSSHHAIQPADTLYIGNDMLKDVWPAAACGLRTALFAGDARSLRLREDDERCTGLAPDLVLTELRQLPACLA